MRTLEMDEMLSVVFINGEVGNVHVNVIKVWRGGCFIRLGAAACKSFRCDEGLQPLTWKQFLNSRRMRRRRGLQKEDIERGRIRSCRKKGKINFSTYFKFWNNRRNQYINSDIKLLAIDQQRLWNVFLNDVCPRPPKNVGWNIVQSEHLSQSHTTLPFGS